MPAGHIGPRQRPTYAAADLAAALKAAGDAVGTQLTPAGYEKLCRLAEVVTFRWLPRTNSKPPRPC